MIHCDWLIYLVNKYVYSINVTKELVQKYKWNKSIRYYACQAWHAISNKPQLKLNLQYVYDNTI